MPSFEPSDIKLRIVPVRSLRPHEEMNPFRVKRLINSLLHHGKLRNPPIVTEFGDQYIVLDGITRTTALAEMGCRDILVQIVDYSHGPIELKSWNHVIIGLTHKQLLSSLAKFTNPILQSSGTDTSLRQLSNREILAHIFTTNGLQFALPGKDNLRDQVAQLCQLVAVYRNKAEVHRSTTVDLPTLLQQYPDMSAVIEFTRFQTDEIIQIAKEESLLPMGLTRHIISGRALGLNIPIEKLMDSQPLDEKNYWLHNLIKQRIHANKIRLYQEPVFIFDD